MIIQCDKCSTKFRLDDSKVSTNAVKVRCTKCRNIFVVQPPQLLEAAEIEEQAGNVEAAPPLPPVPPAGEGGPRPEPLAMKRTDKQDGGKYSLKFDFARPDEDMMQGQEEKPPAPEKDEGASIAPDLSFGDIDLSSVDRQKAVAGRKEEKTAESPLETVPGDEAGQGTEEPTEAPRKHALPQAKSGQDAFDFDFSMEGQDKEEPASPPLEKSAGEGKGVLLASQEKAARAFGGSPAAKATADEQSLEARSSGSFTNALEEAIAKESSEERPAPQAEEATMPARRRPMPAWVPALIAAGAVILIGLAVIYNSGLSGRQGAREKAAIIKPIVIETINGYMADNKNIGRVFVIEALIRNITDSAQGIKEVRGVVYNSSGARIIDRIVSPGRVVSSEELKNLPKEGLIKALSDTSGSLIPPRATVPVMVLFTEIPDGMAEYGLDVIL